MLGSPDKHHDATYPAHQLTLAHRPPRRAAPTTASPTTARSGRPLSGQPLEYLHIVDVFLRRWSAVAHLRELLLYAGAQRLPAQTAVS